MTVWREARLVRRKSPVLLPAVGGFRFVLLGVGVLFVLCYIARRMRVLVRPKTKRFARHRRALCPGAKRLCYCPPLAGFNLAERFARHRRAVCLGAKCP